MKQEAKSSSDPKDRTGKKLFIVKGKESSTRVFEAFLRNRDWEVSSTTDLKTALVTILGQPIQYALVSVDHPNPKILRLPGIITQTINIPVILFAEGSSQLGINYLRNSKHPYILYPPVSGPAVERMIIKIEKDLAAAVSVANITESFQSDKITIGGEAAEGAGGFRNSKSFSMEDVVRLFEGDGSSGKVDESGVIQMGGGLVTEEGRTGSMLSGTASGKAGTVFKNRQGESGDHDGPGAITGSGARLADGSPVNGTGGDAANSSSSSRSALQANDGDAASAMNGTGDNAVAKDGMISSNKAEISEGDGRRGRSSLSKQQRTAEEEQELSVLVKGAEHALSKVGTVNLSDSEIEISKTCTHVSCFNIESTHFNGYLVVAFGAERHVDAFFNESLRDNLVQYLADHGVHITSGDLLDLQLNQVCFEHWSMTEALFLRKAIHRDNEVALAFFPKTEKESPLELSAESHMCKMDLKEIRTNTNLEFDVYIYLPTNRKYVRYAARTRQLPDTQKNKLMKGGHEEVHVRKDMEKDVMRYRVQNFLNDKIKSYSGSGAA